MKYLFILLLTISACENEVGLHKGECVFTESFDRFDKVCYSLCGRGSERTWVTQVPCPKTRWFFE